MPRSVEKISRRDVENDYLTCNLLIVLKVKSTCDEWSNQIDGIRCGRRLAPRPSMDTNILQISVSVFIYYLSN